MGLRTFTETTVVEKVLLDCDACGMEHVTQETCVVIPWEVSPRTTDEDPVTHAPIVTEAVLGDPLVLCRVDCIRKVAELLRV